MKHKHQQGFALVVIAALFIAFSVIAAVVVERNSISAQAERQARAREQLSRIANAMVNYSLVNRSTFNPFPCPARVDLLMSDPNFGVPISGCHNGGTAPAGVDLLPTRVDDLTSPVLRGMVPVRALADFGIGVNDAIDPWNNRIMYVVNRNLTPNSTTLVSPGAASITLTNYVSATIASNALLKPDFILISYGPDGRGAYPKARTTITVPCATTNVSGVAQGTNPRDQNCADQTAGTAFRRQPANTASNATAATYFDDIVAYYSR